MPLHVTIVDYGMGNLHSIQRKLKQLGAKCLISTDASDIHRAERLVMPGVGHFGAAMGNLRERRLVGALHEAANVRRIPILGICLGMQLMASRSDEGNAEGLGWLGFRVVRFEVEDRARHKVPHMGWNTVSARKQSALFAGVSDQAEFYFAHSYHADSGAAEGVLCETDYGYRFPSGVERGNVFGVQFHPEKSHEAGIALLKNFLAL